jgi:hypothetical protein
MFPVRYEMNFYLLFKRNVILEWTNSLQQVLSSDFNISRPVDKIRITFRISYRGAGIAQSAV